MGYKPKAEILTDYAVSALESKGRVSRERLKAALRLKGLRADAIDQLIQDLLTCEFAHPDGDFLLSHGEWQRKLASKYREKEVSPIPLPENEGSVEDMLNAEVKK